MATRVLMVFDLPYTVKPGYDYAEEFADPEGSYTENNVWQALLECGYEVQRLSLYDDVRPLLDAVRDFKPDVIFNLCDVFKEVTHWDKNILALMELLDIPCTGATSSSLFLCNDKGLCKKILRFHRVRTPRFHAFYKGHKVWLPKTLKLPCIVKPLTEEASRGISQASIVDDEKSFLARVQMIHERMKLDAIAEEYIEGRELYVSIIGDRGFLNGQILDLAYMILFAGLILLAIFAVKRSVVMTALALLIVLHLSFIPLDVLHRHGVW